MNSPASPYTIRRGTIGDAAAMARIFNHYVATSDVIFSDTHLSAGDMAARLAPIAGKFPFMVAEGDDGEVIGYCYAHLWQPDPVYRFTWELTEYLDNRCCGRGVGTALLSAVISQCRQGGAHSLISCVTATNEPCINMLIRLGFERVGCVAQSGYKFGRWHDDVFLQLML
ncbi:MAG: N-acetyltransferase [Muribaculaceae bacterium]|nr:N-acetyltransferase [Muribaculaceae bacterium]